MSRAGGAKSIDWRNVEPADLVVAATPACDLCSWVWHHDSVFKLKAVNRLCREHGHLPVAGDALAGHSS